MVSVRTEDRGDEGTLVAAGLKKTGLKKAQHSGFFDFCFLFRLNLGFLFKTAILTSFGVYNFTHVLRYRNEHCYMLSTSSKYPTVCNFRGLQFRKLSCNKTFRY